MALCDVDDMSSFYRAYLQEHSITPRIKIDVYSILCFVNSGIIVDCYLVWGNQAEH